KIKKSVSISVDQELANETAEQIKKRTQLGFGVDDNGRQTKLKPLSMSYRAQRRGEIAFFTDESGRKIPYIPSEKPTLSPYTSPAKSNLTKTGEMLESIKGIVKDTSIFINVTGKRRDGSGLTNEEVKEFVEQQGREFMRLTNGEKNELARKLKDRILRNLK